MIKFSTPDCKLFSHSSHAASKTIMVDSKTKEQLLSLKLSKQRSFPMKPDDQLSVKIIIGKQNAQQLKVLGTFTFDLSEALDVVPRESEHVAIRPTRSESASQVLGSDWPTAGQWDKTTYVFKYLAQFCFRSI